MSSGNWSKQQHTALEKKIDDEVVSTYKEAETYGTIDKGPFPPIPTMFDDVYKEQLWNQRRQRQELGH
jgi:2-oxoisovalerate dehydrogenase E1 component alpha subunit